MQTQARCSPARIATGAICATASARGRAHAAHQAMQQAQNTTQAGKTACHTDSCYSKFMKWSVKSIAELTSSASCHANRASLGF
mmetsp:Transcript_40692/g.100181  ORF Transcript_40692/g.100181 Transcript_40692/m.100181 type:complete len:84 (+) Transcript_40692:132-383(+)